MIFSPELWISAASVTIACCALGVTVWQGRQNIRHNKLSVRPFLMAHENTCNITGTNRSTIKFTLENCGTGPAIIKDFILLYDGKQVAQNNQTKFHDFLESLLKSYQNVNTTSFIPQSALPVGSKTTILKFDYLSQEDDISFVTKLDIIVHYCSIYECDGTTYTYDSRKDRAYDNVKDII